MLRLPGSAPQSDLSEPELSPSDPDKLIRRFYSIASSSKICEYMEFYISMVSNGALTPRFLALDVGDPDGRCPGIDDLDRVVVGGGSSNSRVVNTQEYLGVVWAEGANGYEHPRCIRCTGPTPRYLVGQARSPGCERSLNLTLPRAILLFRSLNRHTKGGTPPMPDGHSLPLQLLSCSAVQANALYNWHVGNQPLPDFK